MTAEISQTVDILAKVYVVEHCQTSRVLSTLTGQNESTVFGLYKPYRKCTRKELWEVIFGKDLCTKSMEEKGGRPEN